MRTRGRWVATATLVTLACARAGDLGQQLNPFGSQGARIEATAPYGPYLVTGLRFDGRTLRLLVFPTEVCQRVLAPEASVVYQKTGVFGRIDRGDERCEVVGVASLAAWRDRQPRASGPAFPRRTARFEILHREESLVLARGWFPLVERIGIPAGYELVALLPDDESCRHALERGEASMEFRDSGPDPYRLVGSRGTCPVLGFARPPSQQDSRSRDRESPRAGV